MTCDEGYSTDGTVGTNGSVTCQSNGTFTALTCSPIICTPMSVDNSDKSENNSITGVYQSEITVDCNDGFSADGTIGGNGTATCQANGIPFTEYTDRSKCWQIYNYIYVFSI